MRTLEDINDKYINDIDAIDVFIQSVYKMFFSLCETKAELRLFLPTLYSSISTKNISSNYNDIKQEIYNYVYKLEQKLGELDEIDSEVDEVTPDDPTADGDLMLFFYSEIGKGKTDRDYLFNMSQDILEALCNTKGPLIHGNRFYELYDDKNEVYKLIDIALNNNAYKEKKQVCKIIQLLNKIEDSLSIFDLTNLMNVYRQCYIQIMAYFDNCIFELFENCMTNNFFFWLDKFKNSTIKTHEMAEFSSFEEFRDAHIHVQLKNCYVKDLLQILRGIDNSIFEEDGTDVFAEMQELIGRRNTHIHNNGIVDKAYIENYNIYNKVEGEFLVIDEKVLKRAQKITKNTIMRAIEKLV
jgi:hypothetical protein